MLLLISSFGGGSVVVALLALEIVNCADKWPLAVSAGGWANLLLHIVVLVGLSVLVCLCLSRLSRDVRGGRTVGMVAACGVGATAWLIPAAMIMEAAYALGAGECSVSFFGAILLFNIGAVCIGCLSIVALLVMALASARPRS